jgi:hypothetical protein
MDLATRLIHKLAIANGFGLSAASNYGRQDNLQVHQLM